MKTLFVRNYAYLCDENSNGKPDYPRLSATTFLAAAYCKSKGHDVELLSVVNDEDYRIDDYDIVVVWVPLFEGFELHLEYLRRAKVAGKKTIMVLNDALEGLEREAMERYDFIDLSIRPAERELVLEQVLTALEKRGEESTFDFSGVMYRDHNKIVDTGKVEPTGPLEYLVSSSEFLKKEDLSLYDQAFIEVGRGCPYPCEFCYINATPHRVRKIEDILDELKVVAGHMSFIWLHDNNMLFNKSFTKELCHAIIENGIVCEWGTEGRIELCDDLELLEIMYRAGCRKIATGLESGDLDILKNIKKATNLKNLEMATENCKRIGIDLSVNIMIGYPWEDEEKLDKTLKVASKYNISFVQFIRPLRGTPLYTQYKQLGIFEGDLGLDDYINCRDEPMFPTLYLSKEELIRKRRIFALKSFKSLKQILHNKFTNLIRVMTRRAG